MQKIEFNAVIDVSVFAIAIITEKISWNVEKCKEVGRKYKTPPTHPDSPACLDPLSPSWILHYVV